MAIPKMDYSHDLQIATMASLPGGPEVIRRAENDSSFHDANLLTLELGTGQPAFNAAASHGHGHLEQHRATITWSNDRTVGWNVKHTLSVRLSGGAGLSAAQSEHRSFH